MILIWEEDLHPAVPGISHHDAAINRYSNADRLVKLAQREAGGAKLGDGLTFRSEDHHALVARIGDIDAAIRIDSNAARAIEDRATRSRVGGAPGGQKRAVGSEFLDAVIPGIGDINRAIGTNCHAPGLIEVAASRLNASLHRGKLAPRIEQSFAIGAEMQNPMRPGVGDIE